MSKTPSPTMDRPLLRFLLPDEEPPRVTSDLLEALEWEAEHGAYVQVIKDEEHRAPIAVLPRITDSLPACLSCTAYWERKGVCVKAAEGDEPGRPWCCPSHRPRWCPGYHPRESALAAKLGLAIPGMTTKENESDET